MRNKEKNEKKKEYQDEFEIKPKQRKKVYKQKYDHINYWLEESNPDAS
jgi:hypothetical protein